MQEVPLSLKPAGQDVQVFAAPEHVLHDLSHEAQVLVPNVPSSQAVQV